MENSRFKFRAWARHTVNNKIMYGIQKANFKYDHKEPLNKESKEWSEWYDEKHDAISSYYPEFEGKEITEIDKMIDDGLFSVGKINTTNAGYKLLSIMQYTGLKDKNGVEIYEGDILSLPMSNVYYVVKSIENMFILESEFTIFKESIYFNERVVIGNIYENGDLL